MVQGAQHIQPPCDSIPHHDSGDSVHEQHQAPICKDKSIQHPQKNTLTIFFQAIGSHVLGLVFFSGLYLGWAGIGKALTGWYAFDWLDKSIVGSEEAVTAYCIGFVFLAPISESFLVR
jgi:hypothetical protein